MFDASDYWITVVELPQFEADAADLLTAEECEGLIAYLARSPDEGVVLDNTGGVRVLDWPDRAGESEGGASVFYFYRDLNMPLYILGAVKRGEEVKLSQSEEAAMRAITTDLVASLWNNQVAPLVKAALRPSA